MMLMEWPLASHKHQCFAASTGRVIGQNNPSFPALDKHYKGPLGVLLEPHKHQWLVGM